MGIIEPIKPPRTDDPKELKEWMRVVSTRLGYLEYAGDPTGNVLPRYIGDMCLDSVSGLWYVASGLTVNDW